MWTLKGKKIFVWRIKLVGQWEEFAVRLRKMGVTGIIVKVADGAAKYNLRLIENGTWQDDLAPAFCQFMKKEGFTVWGYQYVYHTDPLGEANRFLERSRTLGLDGLVIDAESEVESLTSNKLPATAYMKALRPNTPLPIALASFRFPSVHAGFPWKAYFDNGVNLHMPQVYWVKAFNVAEQLKRSHKELLEIANLPFVPIGAAYEENGWRPRVEEMKSFHQTVLNLGLTAEAWWAWDDEGISKYSEYEQVITSFEWPLPPQPVKTLEERVADLEFRVKVLEETGLGTSFESRTN